MSEGERSLTIQCRGRPVEQSPLKRASLFKDDT